MTTQSQASSDRIAAEPNGADTRRNESHAAAHRSPLLLHAERSGLLVVDVQERLLPMIAGHAAVVHNIRRLVRGAAHLQVSTIATEQYPRGLGHTHNDVVSVLKECGMHEQALEKTMFSCRECSPVIGKWLAQGRHQLVLAGIETHVCVMQTALDLISSGFDVYVVVDATSSRNTLDKDIALRRMEAGGVTLVTTESVLFEWVEDSSHPEFKPISQLIKQAAPAET